MSKKERIVQALSGAARPWRIRGIQRADSTGAKFDSNGAIMLERFSPRFTGDLVLVCNDGSLSVVSRNWGVGPDKHGGQHFYCIKTLEEDPKEFQKTENFLRAMGITRNKIRFPNHISFHLERTDVDSMCEFLTEAVEL